MARGDERLRVLGAHVEKLTNTMATGRGATIRLSGPPAADSHSSSQGQQTMYAVSISQLTTTQSKGPPPAIS